jgi:restriction system protein
MKHWILLTKENSLTVWVVPEGDQYTYEITPNDGLKKGDTVYLWSNPHRSFYGWGEIAETPRIIMVGFPRPNNDIELKKRMSILVNRKKEFHPPITERMMLWDKNLKDLIPKGYDDLCAIFIRPGLAHYINDYAREHNLEPPAGSVTVEVKVQEPQFLIKTLLHFEGATDEGKIVRAVGIPWLDIIDMLIRDPKAAFQISPENWEQIIAGAYKQAGFDKVILTPRSGDYGRDVIAIKEGLGEIRVIDQVKAFKPDHLVDANDVRALLGVLQKEPASKGFVTTTSDFAPGLRTDPFVAPLIPQKLGLINGEKLIERLIQLRNK